jgi:antitoxin MazE
MWAHKGVDMNIIRSKVVKIGNSRGVRIPSTILHQLGLIDEVELKVEGNHLIVEAIDRTRKDWELRFEEMTKKGDDLLLDQAFTTKWDEEEWSW